MSDDADRRHEDPRMNEPGDAGQPGEFIDTPENEPGDQGTEPLSDVANPEGIEDANG